MSEAAAPPGLFDRAIRRLTAVWRDMAAGVAEEDDSIEAQMRACLRSRGGEVSARNRAARLAQTYLSLDDERTEGFSAHTGNASIPIPTPSLPPMPLCSRRMTRPSAPSPRRICGAPWSRPGSSC